MIVSGGISTTDVTERSQQHAVLSPPRTIAARSGVVARGASSTPPMSPQSHFRTAASTRCDRATRAELVGTIAHVREHVPRLDQFEVPQRDRGRERVPAEGVSVVQRARAEIGAEERVEHPTARDRRRHREVPAGDAFAEAHQVGSEVALLGREEGAGTAEPGRDLVTDQQHVVGPARGTEPGETVRVGGCMPCLRPARAVVRRDHRQLRRALRPSAIATSKQSGAANSGARNTGSAADRRSVPKPLSPSDKARSCAVVWRHRTRGTSIAAAVRPVLPCDLQRCSTAAPSDA